MQANFQLSDLLLVRIQLSKGVYNTKYTIDIKKVCMSAVNTFSKLI